MDAWCDAFADLGTITQACKRVNISRQTIKRWLDSGDSYFCDNFAQARERHSEKLEALMFAHLDGSEVFGSKSKAFAPLLMFALRKSNPAYRESFDPGAMKESVEASQLLRLLRKRRDAPATTSKAIDQANAIIQGES